MTRPVITTDPSTNEGLFGPGIFGTGIDVSALSEDTAWRLGVFFGEQLAAAEARGYERAVANLRTDAAEDAEDAVHDRLCYANDQMRCPCTCAKGGAYARAFADYLDAMKENDHA